MVGLFLKKYKAVDEKIAKWAPPVKKQQYLTTFSSSSWQRTAQGRKTLHQLDNCKCCIHMHPVECSLYPRKNGCVVTKREPFTELQNQAKKLTSTNSVNPSQKEIKTDGTAIYNEFNDVCNNRFGKYFGDVLTMVPEASLQKKLSPAEAKKKTVNK